MSRDNDWRMGSSIDVLSEGEIGALGVHVGGEEKEVEGGQAATLVTNPRRASGNRRPLIHAVRFSVPSL